MPANLEVKVRVRSLSETRRRLQALPAYAPAGTLRQQDVYFETQQGYLKLRRQGGDGTELIGYRRPKKPGARQSRYARCPVADAASLRRCLSHALEHVCTVDKTRSVFLRDGVRIHLDRVVGLGDFVEIEVSARRAVRHAARILNEVVEDLGLAGAKAIPGSYRDMLAPPAGEAAQR